VGTCRVFGDTSALDAEEIGKCTERGELLDLLRASAPAPTASGALDEPVCALDISWERLQISYDKGGEVRESRWIMWRLCVHHVASVSVHVPSALGCVQQQLFFSRARAVLARTALRDQMIARRGGEGGWCMWPRGVLPIQNSELSG